MRKQRIKRLFIKEKETLTYEEKLKLYEEWVKFYLEHKWVQQENGRWKFVELELTKPDH
jgi:hypothetical protein